MSVSTKPIPPVQAITPQMVADAKRALGACHQCADKIASFRAAGYDFPDHEQMNNDIRRKAEGIIAAYESQQMYGAATNGQQLNGG